MLLTGPFCQDIKERVGGAREDGKVPVVRGVVQAMFLARHQQADVLHAPDERVDSMRHLVRPSMGAHHQEGARHRLD